MGFIGFFVKLIFIPINNIIVGMGPVVRTMLRVVRQLFLQSDSQGISIIPLGSSSAFKTRETLLANIGADVLPSDLGGANSEVRTYEVPSNQDEEGLYA